MSLTPEPEPENVTDLAAFRARHADRMPSDDADPEPGVEADPESGANGGPGAGPGDGAGPGYDAGTGPGSGFLPPWPEPGTKPLPLHPVTTVPSLLRVRVDLVESTPPIWRTLEVPAHLTLDVLHGALQVAFDFTDSHLHRFALTADPFAHEFVGILTPFDVTEGNDGVLESELRLDQLLASPGDTLLYTYDFGDNWNLLLTLEGVDAVVPTESTDGASTVRCIAGARRGVIDDVGGVHGWEELLTLARSGTVPYYTEQGRLLKALGLLDLVDEVDLDGINRGLRRLAGAPAALAWLRAQPIGAAGPSALVTLMARQSVLVQQELAGYLAAAEVTQPIDLGEAEAATAVIRGYLGLVGEGIRFTEAGYLQPAAVRRIMVALDVDRRWRGPANRESQTYPVLNLREAVTLLGLTRKFKGELRLTPKGRALQNDPVGLLTYLATRLPVEKTPAGTDMALLLLLLVAAGEAESLDAVRDRIDLLSSMIGWQYDDGGGRYGNRVAIQDAFDTMQVLDWAGLGQLMPPRGQESLGLASPRARLLARAALTSWA